MAVLGKIVDAAAAFRMDGKALARWERIRRAALGNFLMTLDSPEDLCHTQAESYLGGWERMTYPELIEGLRAEDAERFLRSAFRPEALAISVIRPNQ